LSGCLEEGKSQKVKGKKEGRGQKEKKGKKLSYRSKAKDCLRREEG